MSNGTSSIATDEQLFNNYRASLKSLRATFKGDTRTGSRKQQALKQTADRYGKPISYVKSVVKRTELERGITHEHTQNYLDELRYNREAQQYENEIRAAQKEAGITDGTRLACEGCNSTEKSALIRVRAPYSTERDENHFPTHQFSAMCYISYFYQFKLGGYFTVANNETCEEASARYTN